MELVVMNIGECYKPSHSSGCVNKGACRYCPLPWSVGIAVDESDRGN